MKAVGARRARPARSTRPTTRCTGPPAPPGTGSSDSPARARRCRSRRTPACSRCRSSRPPTRNFSCGRQGVLVVVAADHGDPAGGRRRKSGDRGRSGVGTASRNPSVPGTPVGPRLRQRGDRRNASGLLRHRPGSAGRTARPAVSSPTRASRMRSTRSSTCVSGQGIHFRTAGMSNPPISRKRSRSGGSIHYFKKAHRPAYGRAARRNVSRPTAFTRPDRRRRRPRRSGRRVKSAK